VNAGFLLGLFDGRFLEACGFKFYFALGSKLRPAV
jgi:hypothetical protein